MVKEFMHKGKTIKVNPNIMDEARINASLNATQLAHRRGLIDVYEPIEAYEERWVTKYKKIGYWEDYESSHPVEGTQRRNDLPPIYLQWKEAARRD